MLPNLPERYRPTRRIGEGATAVVWHAEDRLLDAEVAVKIVKPNLALHRRFRSRFAREVALSTRVVHPHIVPVHDTGILAEGEPFVALGYAAGGSLADLLKLRPEITAVLRLMDEVLDALSVLHARGLLHQDLKPANVLLCPRVGGVVAAWIADLGVADALSELNRDKKGISGTPGYMAPEQLMGRTQELGPWTDLYAVGLMLYEILSGERPHGGEGRQELLDARLAPPPVLTLQGDSGKALSEVVRSLLDPDPRQRFDRAADVRVALSAALKGVSFEGRVSYKPHGHSSASTGPILASGATPLSVAPPETLHEGTPRWNRAQPADFPAKPQLGQGWGAPARSSLSLFALREIPLVGRERELQVLWTAAQEVIAQGQPRVVLVVGEPGSGKSRLLDTVGQALEEGGWMETTRLRYHQPAGMDDGYRGAVRDLLVPWNDTRDGMENRLCRWISRDRQAPAHDVLEEATLLARWCGYLKEGERPVGDAVGLAYLYRHLDVRAWRGGSCLILQDVHHASGDGDGLAILEALLDKTVGQRPVLVLASLDSQAVQASEFLNRKIESLQERGALRIGLRRLNLTETRRVVQESLTLEPELARLVSIEFEGNPLGAGLVLRDWALRKWLRMDERKQYRLISEIKLEDALPQDLGSVAARRVQAVIEAGGESAREALLAAALSEAEPPVQLLRSLNEVGLDMLFGTGILVERDGYLSFEHEVVREAALKLARTAPERASIHRKLAAAWEMQQSASDMDMDLPLGYHRLKGELPEIALGALLSAVRRMNQGGRAKAAIRVATLAIEAADQVGHAGGKLEARRLHAEALVEVGEPERALALIERALLEVEGDRLGRAWLRVVASRARRTLGDLEGAAQELNKAGVAFNSLQDQNGKLAVAIQRARLAAVEGNQEEEIWRWTEVLRENRGDFSVESEARNGLVQALSKAGQKTHLEEQLKRLERVSRVSADVRRIAEATFTIAMVRLQGREIEEAEKLLKASGAIAATLGDDHLNLRCRVFLAEAARFRGDQKTALELNRWAVRYATERGWKRDAASARVQLALLSLQIEDFKGIRAEVEAAEADLSSSPKHGLWLHVGLLRALIGAEEGDERTCRAWWAVARERGLDSRHAPDLWLPLQRLAAAASRAGWEDLARQTAAALSTSSEAESVVVEEEES